MNGNLNYKPNRKTEIVWLTSKRKNKEIYYRGLSEKQLKTEYLIDDLEHLYRPYGSEK